MLDGGVEMTAEEVIKHFDLQPLTMEGGYFRQNYRSTERLPSGKPIGTAIYFLLTPDTFSRLHKLPTDEVYHFYLGDPVELLVLRPDGKGEKIILGKDFERGMHLQFAVPAGCWQGSRLLPCGSWALLGTTMAPGFTDDDFISAQSDVLLEQYPQYEKEIKKLL